MKVFAGLGLPVLRFNFRGVGLSEGEFDHGVGELDDARAGLDWLDAKLHLPILLVGFSFGSYVGMRAGCCDARVQGMIGLGVPYRAEGRSYTYEFLDDCTQPKLYISGTEDQFGPRKFVEPMLEETADPKRIVWIDGAEHFFKGTPSSPGPKLDLMQAAIRQWLADTFELVAG
jgi:alpha/beta superfamily hydrolase